MLAELRREDFVGFLNQAFPVRLETGSVEFELVEAKSLAPGGGGPGRPEPFTLLFRGPAEPALPQAIRRLEHPTLGDLDVFLVPVGRDGSGGVLYEAIFN